jgi:hypothetical protein
MLNGKFWIAMVVAIVILVSWDYLFLKDQRDAENLKKQEILKSEQKQLPINADIPNILNRLY